MFDIIAGIFNFIKNLFWVASRKPGSSWLLGNVRPIDAKAAIILLILLGAVIGGGVVWYVARRRRAAAILQTLAAGYSSFSFWLKDGGALYIDGVKGRYVSTEDFSTEPTSPAFDLRLTTKQAKKLLDRAGFECFD
ncbi:hypothetical protein LOB55_03825 [Lactobacillus delbrueckii subsp. lactis]|jgi:hypothetical protein|uniref:hypothetical protein n=1 Tax=Lactobacillales TaxID=186826 RepID=UPI0001EC3492|nr:MULTISPECIES: hypothetical protein [Lactobacillales]ADQ61239.1 Hypothetical protein LDBND_1204 [Lactobacillus delbrueckii subsp. bulgaricus ND02]MBO3081445.1 hypothetical protein [Lactobacillus delbrueckii subsp. bulgaricus]MCD5438075.1 hypothetical protein [Lactobacillus delbrueckii subsp. lactis]MCD5468625.1 hypothetical protein [Lactobacillus delbrueckii subsp. lactis]MCZ0795592.1 hypothetical protein [Lactobacillus delbrueckii subsp. lactis]